MIDLSPAQAADRITALLAASESRTLDFKRISGKQGRLYEAVCAFANTEGGASFCRGTGQLIGWARHSGGCAFDGVPGQGCGAWLHA